MTRIACLSCGMEYPKNANPFRCECGGIYDFTVFPKFTARDRSVPGLWGYQASLGTNPGISPISLGEGSTPLIPVECGGKALWLKMESQNATGSYKDRGSTVLVSHLKDRGVDYAIEDSSGNAGASFAAYCARGGIKSRVYVPESASGPKRTQIEIYGAELVQVPGVRAEAAKAVLVEAERGAVYASHAYMPFGLTGIATIAYELVEQLECAPAAIIAPVGHGGLLYGIMLGFEALAAAGWIKDQPYYMGVQAEACAPLASAYLAGELSPGKTPAGATIAEGVKVVAPMRGAAILARLQYEKGCMISVSESDLRSACQELAQKGVYCEPTSALVWAAVKQMHDPTDKPTVAVITGSGYKSTLFHTGIV